MNIMIFSLTVLAFCGIMIYARKAYKKADVKGKMEEIKDLEELEAEILEFKKTHKGDLKKKRKKIKNFIKE